jgi:hypothetical protein
LLQPTQDTGGPVASPVAARAVLRTLVRLFPRAPAAPTVLHRQHRAAACHRGPLSLLLLRRPRLLPQLRVIRPRHPHHPQAHASRTQRVTASSATRASTLSSRPPLAGAPRTV